MEKFIYEAKPYIAIAAACYALTLAPKTNFLMGCGVVLIFCALYLLKLRAENRNSMRPRRSRR